MKVRFATSAKRDLREIALRIAEDNVPRSITFVEEVDAVSHWRNIRSASPKPCVFVVRRCAR